jgi:hypothetical protein
MKTIQTQNARVINDHPSNNEQRRHVESESPSEREGNVRDDICHADAEDQVSSRGDIGATKEASLNAPR